MNPFLEMLQKTRSLPQHQDAMRFVKPLQDHFGISHFWHSRISQKGDYAYIGSNAEWDECCFGEQLFKHFPSMRHPNIRTPGLYLDQDSTGESYQKALRLAEDRFQIHFSLTLVEPCEDGIEQFGFGVRFEGSEEKLLNELPLLRHFIREFKKKHGQLLSSVQKHDVSLPTQMGSKFYEHSASATLPLNRERFLLALGCYELRQLTDREKEILVFLASGFPASYIKDQLHLSIRTVENYIAALKEKLECDSKTSLIKKAQELLPLFAHPS